MQNPKQYTALRSPRTASVALAPALLKAVAVAAAKTLVLAGKPLLLLADQGLPPSTDLRATPSWH